MSGGAETLGNTPFPRVARSRVLPKRFRRFGSRVDALDVRCRRHARPRFAVAVAGCCFLPTSRPRRRLWTLCGRLGSFGGGFTRRGHLFALLKNALPVGGCKRSPVTKTAAEPRRPTRPPASAGRVRPGLPSRRTTYLAMAAPPHLRCTRPGHSANGTSAHAMLISSPVPTTVIPWMLSVAPGATTMAPST